MDARLLYMVVGVLGLALCVFAGCLTILASGTMHDASPNQAVTAAIMAFTGGIGTILGFIGGILVNPSTRQQPQQPPAGVLQTQPATFTPPPARPPT